MGIEGQTIDAKYVVKQRLGGGGMGEVYDAVHGETERHVAIKVLFSDYAGHPEALERFRREARAAGRIGHDNICEVLDVGRLEGGAPYLVMPLLRGETLGEAMRRTGPMSVARTLDIGAQVLSALTAAHAAQIVHRDLKPDNIMLTRVGDREDFVKVLDFGICKAIGSATDISLTQTGTVLGTPHYMAPEQARGRKDVDGRVDTYALGVILYQMLTTKVPFDGDSYNAVISAILVDSFSLPRALRAEIPPPVEAVVLRAMSRDREQRFPDAAGMRRALLEAARAGGKSAAVVDTGARTLDSSHGFAAAARPADEDAAVGPAGTAGASPGGPATSDAMALSTAGTTAMRRARTRRTWVAVGVLVAVAASVAVGLFMLRSGERAGDARGSSDVPVMPGVPAELQSAAQPPVAQPDGSPSVATSPAVTPADVGPAFEERPPVAEVLAGTDAAGPGMDAAAGDASNAAAVPTVRITLVDLPAGAAVLFDGKEVPGPPFDLPQADRTVPVEVTAPEHEPWRGEASLREDGTVEVSMIRKRVSPRVQDAGRGTGRDAAPVSGRRDAGGTTGTPVPVFSTSGP